MNVDLSSVAEVEISGSVEPEIFSHSVSDKSIRVLIIRSSCLSDAHIAAIEKCKKISYLLFHDCEFASSKDVLASLCAKKGVVELQVIGCRKEEAFIGIGKCESIQCVAIQQMKLSSLLLEQLMSMPKLEKVDFEGCTISEGELIEFIKFKRKQLLRLSLAEVTSVTGKVLETLAACERLEYLDVSKSLSKKEDKAEQERLKYLFDRLRKTLRHIKISEAASITLDVISKGVILVNDLESIDLSDCPNMTNDELFYLVPARPPVNVFPRLKEVRVINCPKVTTAYLDFLKAKVPEVSYIH
jgi:hypothetical protein